jgi:membrane protein
MPPREPGRSSPGIRRLKRLWRRSVRHDLSMMAAGVAFFSLLSLFPALTTLIFIWGLVADPQEVQELIGGLQGLVPDEVLRLVSAQFNVLFAAGAGKLGLGLAASLLFALWSASNAAATLMMALNRVYEKTEQRSFFKVTATALVLTAGLVIFGFLSLMLVAVLPPVIEYFPVPADWREVIGLVRWPLLAALVMAVLAVLYRHAPCRERARSRWVGWGEALATLLWIASSYGFSVYVASFATYHKTYGSLGAVVVLMMWLFITAYVILLGAELDAELER